MRKKIYTIIVWSNVGVGVVGVAGFFLPLRQEEKGISFLLAALIMYLLFELAKKFDPKLKNKPKIL